MTLELISIKRLTEFDEDPDISWLQQDYEDCTEAEQILYKDQDKKRLDALNNDEWNFIGIQAKAEIHINGISETITSPGLWGIEDDPDESYLEEIYQEQKDELAEMLRELGFSDAQLLEAVN